MRWVRPGLRRTRVVRRARRAIAATCRGALPPAPPERSPASVLATMARRQDRRCYLPTRVPQDRRQPERHGQAELVRGTRRPRPRAPREAMRSGRNPPDRRCTRALCPYLATDRRQQGERSTGTDKQSLSVAPGDRLARRERLPECSETQLRDSSLNPPARVLLAELCGSTHGGAALDHATHPFPMKTGWEGNPTSGGAEKGFSAQQHPNHWLAARGMAALRLAMPPSQSARRFVLC